MPLPTERLSPDSSDEAVQEAISAAIQQCMREGGRELKQCQAIAYATARRATRKNLGSRAAGNIRAGLEER